MTLVETTKRTRLAENLEASKLELDEKVLAELDALFGADAIAGARYDEHQSGVVAA